VVDIDLTPPEIEDETPVICRVSDLCADMIGKKAKINVQIVGEQSQKALTKKVIIRCVKCGATDEIDLSVNKDFLAAQLFNKFQVRKDYAEDYFNLKHGMCEDGKKHKIRFENSGFMDYSILFVRDLLLRWGEGDRFDERAYKPRCVYLINQKLPHAKKVTISGVVMLDSRNNDIVLIADEICPFEDDITRFVIDEEKRRVWDDEFRGKKDLRRQIAPHIVGERRDIAKKWTNRVLHSVAEIPDIDGVLKRGALLGAFYGDSTTGKSEIAKDMTDLGNCQKPLGETVIIETGGRTGILYTIDHDRGALIWGTLVVNDLGFVVIDGLQKMHPEEIGELRETLRIQMCKVRRSLSGDALARVRIITCFNPNKPMDSYLYPCMGIVDSRVFTEPPDIARWDFFIPFCVGDVESNLITHREVKERPYPEDKYRSHIIWAWTRRPEDIVYEDDAKKRIMDLSSYFIETYSSPNIPIIRPDFRDVLCRISVAVACEQHSTDDTHEKVIVKREHVEEAARDYEELLELLGIRNYKLEEDGKRNITDNEFTQMCSELGDVEWQILNEVKIEPVSSTVLSDKIGIAPRNIKRHYTILKKHGLITTSPGAKGGIHLTTRGVKFLHAVTQKNGDMGIENITNSSKISPNGDKKYPYITIKTDTPDLKICGKCGEILGDDKEFVGAGLGFLCPSCYREHVEEVKRARELPKN